MKIFNLIFQNKNNKKINNEDIDSISDQFCEIGKLLKEARTKNNLSINDLSRMSKIPESTILAIENNINQYLPEHPFIRSILLKLEKCLFLKKNTLFGLVLKETNTSNKEKENYLLRKFDFLNSWQGSIFYFLLLISILFMINRYFSSNINIIEIQIIEQKINEE